MCCQDFYNTKLFYDFFNTLMTDLWKWVQNAEKKENKTSL